MKKLITIIAILISATCFGQSKMKSIDIECRYENETYLVTYVIDTSQLTSKGWIATVNVYKDGKAVFVGQRGLYDRNRRSTRPTKYEIEFIQTALTLKRGN